MREPFEILLGQYRDHVFLGKHLTGYEPNWEGLATDPDMVCLSSGEKLMVRAAAGLVGRTIGETAPFMLAELGGLDHTNRERIIEALYWSMDMVR